jgi:hypothetical protein
LPISGALLKRPASNSSRRMAAAPARGYGNGQRSPPAHQKRPGTTRVDSLARKPPGGQQQANGSLEVGSEVSLNKGDIKKLPSR